MTSFITFKFGKKAGMLRRGQVEDDHVQGWKTTIVVSKAVGSTTRKRQVKPTLLLNSTVNFNSAGSAQDLTLAEPG